MNSDLEKIRIMELRQMMMTYVKEEENYPSDQSLGEPQPPLAKPPMGGKLIHLTKDFQHVIRNNDFLHLLMNRTSHRAYAADEPLTLDELAYLLFATQGVKSIRGKQHQVTMRTVPSAGARHPLETYLLVNNVVGLEPGLYHYLPLEHKLEFLGAIEDQVHQVTNAFLGQAFLGGAPVGFVWTAVPYRTEWRYTTKAAKFALLDAGHVAQNLYLACESIDCGVCAIAAYDQSEADALLKCSEDPGYAKDGEFVIYAASVGHVKR